MPIGNYLQTIGRGKEGARALDRDQAADLFGQILDGHASDLETGAFCLAMRIKGETAEEMAGFLDACRARIRRVACTDVAAPIVLPSYNGARRLPGLVPLLALLLARAGHAVVIHGTATEARRLYTADVLAALDIGPALPDEGAVAGAVRYVPTAALSPALQRLLQARHLIQLRNPAHSLVKLLNPCSADAILVTSYTHPEYADTMAQVLAATRTSAMLLRGTEGEAVADARRAPAMQNFVRGVAQAPCEAQAGALTDLPQLPAQPGAQATADYIRAVLAGALPVPAPIALQVQRVQQLATAHAAAATA